MQPLVRLFEGRPEGAATLPKDGPFFFADEPLEGVQEEKDKTARLLVRGPLAVEVSQQHQDGHAVGDQVVRESKPTWTRSLAANMHSDQFPSLRETSAQSRKTPSDKLGAMPGSGEERPTTESDEIGRCVPSANRSPGPLLEIVQEDPKRRR